MIGTEMLAAVLLAALALALLVVPRRSGRGRLSRLTGGAPIPIVVRMRQVVQRVERRGRPAVALCAAVGAAAGFLLAGPVAAIGLGTYAAIALRALLRRRAQRSAEAARGEAMDAVTALADDLRAGSPATAALARAWPRLTGNTPASAVLVIPEDPATALESEVEQARRPVTVPLAIALRLAGRTGTPLADLLARLDAELSAQERLRRRFTAQSAGARATAVLLALLPGAGIGLGYAMGTDPLHMLLHTATGAVCLVTMLALQLIGVWWTNRLASVGMPGVAR